MRITNADASPPLPDQFRWRPTPRTREVGSRALAVGDGGGRSFRVASYGAGGGAGTEGAGPFGRSPAAGEEGAGGCGDRGRPSPGVGGRRVDLLFEEESEHLIGWSWLPRSPSTDVDSAGAGVGSPGKLRCRLW